MAVPFYRTIPPSRHSGRTVKRTSFLRFTSPKHLNPSLREARVRSIPSNPIRSNAVQYSAVRRTKYSAAHRHFFLPSFLPSDTAAHEIPSDSQSQTVPIMQDTSPCPCVSASVITLLFLHANEAPATRLALLRHFLFPSLVGPTPFPCQRSFQTARPPPLENPCPPPPPTADADADAGDRQDRQPIRKKNTRARPPWLRLKPASTSVPFHLLSSHAVPPLRCPVNPSFPTIPHSLPLLFPFCSSKTSVQDPLPPSYRIN